MPSNLRPRFRIALLGGAAMLATAGLASCSSDGSDGSETKADTTTTAVDATPTTRAPIDPDSIEGGEEAYTAAMEVLIGDGSGLTPDDEGKAADCLAPKWVAIIGVDGFAAAGVAPDDLSDLGGGFERLGLDAETGEAMAAAFEPCGIDLRRVLIDQALQGGEVTEAQRACIDDAISEEVATQSFVDSLTGGVPDVAMFDDAQACLDATG